MARRSGSTATAAVVPDTDCIKAGLDVLPAAIRQVARAHNVTVVEMLLQFGFLTEQELSDFQEIQRLDFWISREPHSVLRQMLHHAPTRVLLETYRPRVAAALESAKPGTLRRNPAALALYMDLAVAGVPRG